jgi:hypothetical protein
MRYFWSFIILVVTLGWLVLSYLPVAHALPDIAFTGAWTVLWFPAFVTLSIATFLGIQAVLVTDTVKMLRRPESAGFRATIEQFRIRLAPEVFLTVLPIVGTLLLAGAIVVLSRS